MAPSGPIVVTGAAGQLGFDLVAALAGRDVVALDRSGLDLLDATAIRSTIAAIGPSTVVNCAAYTRVDDCESNPELAFAVNAEAVGHLAAATGEAGAHLVQLSTDYVFSGDKPEPYDESDVPDPRSVYGRSKLAGEQAAGPEATVVRTSWLCGEHGPNMVKTILRLAGEHETLRFVDDQRGHPSFCTDVAAVLVELIDEPIAGVVHVTNQGVVSWYEFARAVLETAGDDPDRVEPIATADMQPPRPAPRPANSVLDNRVRREQGREPTRHFLEPLAELVEALTGG